MSAIVREKVRVAAKIDSVIANMECWRWMPHDLGANYVLMSVVARPKRARAQGPENGPQQGRLDQGVSTSRRAKCPRRLRRRVIDGDSPKSIRYSTENRPSSKKP
jgi:hypothetical protein